MSLLDGVSSLDFGPAFGGAFFQFLSLADESGRAEPPAPDRGGEPNRFRKKVTFMSNNVHCVLTHSCARQLTVRPARGGAAVRSKLDCTVLCAVYVCEVYGFLCKTVVRPAVGRAERQQYTRH
jgi:hypothetical protein